MVTGDSDHLCASHTRLGRESGCRAHGSRGLGSQPRPVRTLEGPQQKGRHRVGEGRARGSPTGRCANQALSPPRDSTVPCGPRDTPGVPSSRPGRSTASNAQALPTATGERGVGPCGGLCKARRPEGPHRLARGGLCEAGRPEGPHCPARVAAGKEDQQPAQTAAGIASCTGLGGAPVWTGVSSPHRRRKTIGLFTI